MRHVRRRVGALLVGAARATFVMGVPYRDGRDIDVVENQQPGTFSWQIAGPFCCDDVTVDQGLRSARACSRAEHHLPRLINPAAAIQIDSIASAGTGAGRRLRLHVGRGRYKKRLPTDPTRLCLQLSELHASVPTTGTSGSIRAPPSAGYEYVRSWWRRRRRTSFYQQASHDQATNWADDGVSGRAL